MIRFALALSLSVLTANGAVAQDAAAWPTKPVRLIAPFPAGTIAILFFTLELRSLKFEV